MKWIQCKRKYAREYRVCVLTGSIGLEGKWSKWNTILNNDVPYHGGRYDYQYRCTEEDMFLGKL